MCLLSFTLFLSVLLVQQNINVVFSTSRKEHGACLNVSKLEEMVSGIAYGVLDDLV